MVWFRCVVEPPERTLDLYIANMKETDQDHVSSNDPFSSVRIKFDNSEPVQVFEGLGAVDRLRITFDTLKRVGELQNAGKMLLRVGNHYGNENADFTVTVNMKNNAIQNVFNDCKTVFDRAG